MISSRSRRRHRCLASKGSLVICSETGYPSVRKRWDGGKLSALAPVLLVALNLGISQDVLAQLVVAEPSLALGDTPNLDPPAQAVADALDPACADAEHELGALCKQLLDLSDAERQSALRQLAPEEIITQGTLAIELKTVQTRNTIIRSALRGALQRAPQGPSLPAITFLDLANSKRGGGASADESSTFNRLGFFVGGQGSFGDKDATARETGFDSDTQGITAGLDYRFTDGLVLGAAVGYLASNADFSSSGGDLEADGYSLSAFGSYYVSDKFYIDIIGSHGQNDYETTRNIVFPGVAATAEGNNDGDQFDVSISGGYNFNKAAFSFGPYFRVDYTKLKIDGFSETGADTLNLQIDGQRFTSLTTALGGQVSYAISKSWGVLLPSARVEWEHEYKDSSRSLSASFVTGQTAFNIQTDNPDRNYFHFDVGLSATFTAGRSAFINYGTVLGQTDIVDHSFTAGLRLEF